MEEKIAVVTGGSSGMGLAIAKKLQESGIEVYVLDRQQAPEGFGFFKVDIRNDEEIQSALSQIPIIEVKAGENHTVLLRSTGEVYVSGTNTNEELDKMVDINIKGTYMVTRNAIEKIKQSKGNIVTIASCLGVVPELTSPLYCTTKAGLIMFTKCLAQQYADCGVRVNCVLPGPIDTPLLQNSFLDESMAERCANRIPMKRIGSPEDVANMVSFLVSDDATFITGGAFPVDGGVSSSSLYSK